MARVNITVPDEVITQAKLLGLNVSRVATTALIEELDRRTKIDALDAYLDELEQSLGPIPDHEQAAAAAWAARLSPKSANQPAAKHPRRSA